LRYSPGKKTLSTVLVYGTIAAGSSSAVRAKRWNGRLNAGGRGRRRPRRGEV